MIRAPAPGTRICALVSPMSRVCATTAVLGVTTGQVATWIRNLAGSKEPADPSSPGACQDRAISPMLEPSEAARSTTAAGLETSRNVKVEPAAKNAPLLAG